MGSVDRKEILNVPLSPPSKGNVRRNDSLSRPIGLKHDMVEVQQEQDIFTIRLDWRHWWAIIPEIVTLFCTAILSLVLAANVFGRYTGWYRILWAEDIVNVLFLWIVFLGGAIAVKYEAHVRMSMMSDRFARGGRAGFLLGRAINMSPMVVGIILLVLGLRVVDISMHRELPMIQVPVGYFITIVPASGALMILYVLRNLLIKTKTERHLQNPRC